MLMKKLGFILLIVLVSSGYYAQNFTWIKGLTVSGVISGTVGTQGVSAPGNNPGTRHGAATWVDLSGNLWLMGGEGTSTTSATSWLNDLWKYNPATNEWTWVRGSSGPNAIGVYGTQGVPSNLNEPGAREFAFSWTDASGNFWLFGGDGFASNTTFGKLGDLWRYNPVTNQWTWMKGYNTVDQNGVYGTLNVAAGTNLPGGRIASATWIDAAGNLWLHGGRGFPASGGSGFLNDLWKYSIATNNWTWVKGANTTNQSGTYGTLGVPSTTVFPGGREFANFWQDASGNLYLGSGRGYASGASPGYLNDLWKYNPTADTWTWLNGANTQNPPAAFGTIGVSSPTNSPGGRYSGASWRDPQGNFWMYGGIGWAINSPTNSAAALSNINDLWKYDVLTNQWTWMKGSNYVDQFGVYGTQGVASALNVPGARHFNTWWKEISNFFWLFGGEGLDDSNPSPENLCDLWRFRPPCNPDSVVVSPGLTLCTGNTATLTAANQFPANVQWFTSATGGSSVGSGSVFTTPFLNAPVTPTVYTYYAQATACTVTPRAQITLSVYPKPAVSIVGNTLICAGSNAVLTASGATTYTWNTGVNATTISVSPSVTTIYSVTGANAAGCTSNNSYTVSVNPIPNLGVSASKTVVCAAGNAVTLTVNGAGTYTWSNGANTTSVNVTPTVPSNPGHGLVSYSVTGTDANGCQSTAVISISVAACTGLQDISSDTAILSVYPNPFNQGCHVLVKDPMEGMKIRLVNLIGQVVYEKDMKSEITLIQEVLPAGCYLLQITHQNKVVETRKLIKE